MIVFILILLILILLVTRSSFGSYDLLTFHIINVVGPRGEKRRQNIKKVFKAAGINYVYYPAYTSETVDLNRYKWTKNKGVDNKLFKAEIGLSCGHNDLYKQLLSSTLPFMIIAEDDCTFYPNFKLYLKRLVDMLPEDYCAIKLDSFPHSDEQKTKPPVNDNTPIQLITPIEKDGIWGTACYIVSRKGARYLLELNEPVWLPSDHVFYKKNQNKFSPNYCPSYYTLPRLVWQEPMGSILQDNKDFSIDTL
jgi:hypothetical protein